MLNLDTHILIYALADDLSRKERQLLADAPWSISSIVLWEITKLSELNRIDLDIRDPQFSHAISNIHLWEINLDICRAIQTLDFKGDPADEIIAATSLVHNIPLVTRDRQIRKSKIVPLA
ncbi:MAG: type II toxin-antitoxin system VapC family toxin [Nitrospira sp.]|nr:type II toxin-antitoxin system VapC family toxin [bacterium]MBL7032110.1 type II toxin-antitoxin system VapC family toxin [Nitrospira sp.]